MRRGQEHQDTEEDDAGKAEEEEVFDEIAEENEVTRCVCGQLEYPGPPDVRAAKAAAAAAAAAAAHVAAEVQAEESGSLFIQCDVCKVWQHGGCVGIMDEATSPDDYFCELCKPELHEVSVSKNG